MFSGANYNNPKSFRAISSLVRLFGSIGASGRRTSGADLAHHAQSCLHRRRAGLDEQRAVQWPEFVMELSGSGHAPFSHSLMTVAT